MHMHMRVCICVCAYACAYVYVHSHIHMLQRHARSIQCFRVGCYGMRAVDSGVVGASQETRGLPTHFTNSRCEALQCSSALILYLLNQRRFVLSISISIPASNSSALQVCLCGNHDVGNTPTKDSITRFSNAFGDDYLAFWANGTYNIALNSTLIANHSQAEDLYQDQLKWLQERLAYATEKNARHIFVFSHHPWFLFHEDEDETKDLTGHSRIPAPGSKTEFWDIPDSYFVMPKRHRMVYMDLFRKHKVKAAFCGHFHQNWVAKTSFGMDMIVTGSLSVLLKSTSSSEDAAEPNVQGIRIVDVGGSHGTNGSDGDGDGNGDVNAGVRCEGTFEHKFVPVA
mmetsp:Transcript_17681/g.49079  ORF Transcript_17681/g.49079 Transcript_17681/m.49079 type:complete len:341 (+) Transcript_17681:506-1528(+)